jgi:CRP/FNR family cyclic AMP-dependent transcriptional regulator
MDKIWHLKRFNFFTCLSQSEMIEFSSQTIEKRYAKKELIFLPRDNSDKVYLLKAGVVKISKFSESGKEIILAMVNPGEIFGEMELIEKAKRGTVAEALMDSYVCIVSRDDFIQHLKRNPEMSLQITKIMGIKFKQMGQKVEDLVFRNVDQRLAGLLLSLMDEYGYFKNEKMYIRVKLTHYDIASLIGTTRETTTACLNELKRGGLIDFDGRKIVILDREGLEQRT